MAALLKEHLAAMARHSPPERLHALDVDDLCSYGQFDFELYGPFGDYVLDPNSTFMTRAIRLGTDRMNSQISEADWKIFKQLRELALERFSQEIRAQCIAKFNDSTMTAHERYLAVYSLIQDRDAEIERIFDSLRRSTALLQLSQFWRHGLLGDEEIQALSEETRQLADLSDATKGNAR